VSDRPVEPARGGAPAAARAAFVDRDGVIVEDRGYTYQAADFALLPGAAAALRALQSAGYLLVVVTNQSGIARGLYTEADYEAFTAHMRARLGADGVRLDAIEHCPHLPDAAVERYRLDCECRKPRPGMLRRALAALAIDPAASVLIGDRATDIAAGRAAGIGRCLLVRSGQALAAEDSALADGTYDDLATCVRALLAAPASPRPGPSSGSRA
jgi:D-glycero-D-manno-heptose 1,7-bisphosphate phosphatase